MKELTPRSTFNPFNRLRDLERELDRWMGSTSELKSPLSTSEGFAPLCDLKEDDDKFTLSFDIPGVPKENVNIEAHENRITISGERESEIKEEGYRERSYGRFQRTFTAPTNIDVDNIDAKYKDGVLTLEVPKTEKSKSKKISIH